MLFVEAFAPALLQVRLPFHSFVIRQRMLTYADVLAYAGV